MQFTSKAYLTILSQSSGMSVPPFSGQSEYKMRAEAEALVQSIKQSMGLLRRHL